MYASLLDAYPVESFRFSITTDTSFTFYWRPPSIGAQLTINYLVRCDPVMLEVPTRQRSLEATHNLAVVSDLHPGTSYNCSIFTSGAQGNSEPRSHIITTPDARKTVTT